MTSAAIIMVAVFAVFGTLSLQQFKQLSVGLAVAVLLDATVVRGVLASLRHGPAGRAQLVPAAVAVLAAEAAGPGLESSAAAPEPSPAAPGTGPVPAGRGR